MAHSEKNMHSDRVHDFQRHLAGQPDNHLFVKKYILHAPSVQITGEQEFNLKNVVANQYGLEVLTDIHVVGSAKLGFSIAPKKRFRPFGDESDIDLAIVSRELYVKMWHEVHDYISSYSGWDKRKRFTEHLSNGWIRPDLLPSHAADDWFDFFRGLHNDRTGGPFKPSAGLYYDLRFLEKYQIRSVRDCRSVQKRE